MADINFGEPAEVKVPVVDTENKDILDHWKKCVDIVVQ